MGWNDFSLPAIGERHDNDDGTSRQAELALCCPGEDVRLVREPDNVHDPMAVAVFSCRGVRVGYLRRDRAVWIGSKIDRGYDVRAIVERVKGAHLPEATLGLVMRVNMDGEAPELVSPLALPIRRGVAIQAQRFVLPIHPLWDEPAHSPLRPIEPPQRGRSQSKRGARI